MSNSSGIMTLRALLGDYPNTAALKKGEIRSPRLNFDFADVKVPNHAFKRVVRDLEFDVAELAISTYLTAKAHNKPLVLLPVVVRGKFQHESIVCSAARPLAPSDLPGCRVGIRSHSVTTVTWVRGILQNDYGVDLDRVKWVTFEDAHVAEYRDPPGMERAPAGKELAAMLRDGELDAAVVGEIPELRFGRQRPAVQEDLPHAGVGLVQDDDRLRRLDDLARLRMRVQLHVAERQAVGVRVVPAVVGHTRLQQFGGPRLERQTARDARSDVEEQTRPPGEHGRRARRAARSADTAAGRDLGPAGVPPDAREIGSAVGHAGRRREQIEPAVGGARYAGCRKRRPLRRRRGSRCANDGHEDGGRQAANHGTDLPPTP